MAESPVPARRQKEYMKKRPTIKELEALLQQEDTHDIRILSNGQIKAVKKRKSQQSEAEPKPLTLKEKTRW